MQTFQNSKGCTPNLLVKHFGQGTVDLDPFCPPSLFMSFYSFPLFLLGTEPGHPSPVIHLVLPCGSFYGVLLVLPPLIFFENAVFL